MVRRFKVLARVHRKSHRPPPESQARTRAEPAPIATAGLSVVVPTTRVKTVFSRLLPSLAAGSRLPNEVILVGNHAEHTGGEFPFPCRIIHYSSTKWCTGIRDVVLKRNIGALCATNDWLVFLDDDVAIPRTFLDSCLKPLTKQRYFWGNHRYIDMDKHTVKALLNLDPSHGASRERPPNHLHSWHSSYAGCFGIARDLFWSLGGFDMAFMGRHAGEDQDIGFRLMRRLGKKGTYVFEPPFAWHPTNLSTEEVVVPDCAEVCGHHLTDRNMNSHAYASLHISGVWFRYCSKCHYRISTPSQPSWRPKNDLIVPFDPTDFDVLEL